MRKAAYHSNSVDSSNPLRWRGKRLHHQGSGVCWLFVLLWMDSWHHELIVCRIWYKITLRWCWWCYFHPRMLAPYLSKWEHLLISYEQFLQKNLIGLFYYDLLANQFSVTVYLFLYCIDLHSYSHYRFSKILRPFCASRNWWIIVVFLQSNSLTITIVSQKYWELLQPYSHDHF